MPSNVAQVLGDFHIEGAAMRYSQFVPRLYNVCLSLGFEPGKICGAIRWYQDEYRGRNLLFISGLDIDVSPNRPRVRSRRSS
jgi:hypothetical protein